MMSAMGVIKPQATATAGHSQLYPNNQSASVVDGMDIDSPVVSASPPDLGSFESDLPSRLLPSDSSILRESCKAGRLLDHSEIARLLPDAPGVLDNSVFLLFFYMLAILTTRCSLTEYRLVPVVKPFS